MSPGAGTIAAGDVHSCALKADATVWCWGDAGDGQLGDGTMGDVNFRRLHPVQVVDGGGNLTDVKAIAAGDNHTCALKNDGTVWCWGDGGLGQLGNGTGGGDELAQSLVPVQVLQGAGMLTGVTAIAARSRHTCALKTEGTVWCWGYDGFGQLGDGTRGAGRYETRTTPVQVVQGSGKLTGVKKIALGGQSSCALKTDGTVWCWGDDYRGQLGDGTKGNSSHLRLKPVQVVQGSGKLTGVTAITAGDYHACARKSTGSVWCWGWDYYGQLGDGTRGGSGYLRLKPVRVVYGTGHLTGVSAITTGSVSTCAIKSGGTVWCWGSNSYGQLGDGTRGNASHMRLKPVQVVYGSGKLTGIVTITAGNVHTCAEKAAGTVWCWGYDIAGQLGDGTLGSTGHRRLRPVQVVAFP